jgi:hypothetical protein
MPGEKMMTNNTEKWRGNWSRTREQGVWRYIVLKGLVLFGLIFSAISYILESYLLGRSFEPISFVLRTLIASLIVGSLMWAWNERKYRRNSGTDA